VADEGRPAAFRRGIVGAGLLPRLGLKHHLRDAFFNKRRVLQNQCVKHLLILFGQLDFFHQGGFHYRAYTFSGVIAAALSNSQRRRKPIRVGKTLGHCDLVNLE
jgi:hypothetical protein